MTKIIHIKHSMAPLANIKFRFRGRLRNLFWRSIQDYPDIPVIINNFNRLSYLKALLNWLERAGMRQIYIIDNASTYPPLLEFYKTMPYTLFQLNKNVGHLALWKTHIFKWFEKDYYVYTDPDVVPVEDCPLDAVKYFREILNRYPDISKVGFGLKIDDLPEHYEHKDKVIQWEKAYWEEEIEKDLYRAKIDTTFALYRPGAKGGWRSSALRTGGRYVARHLPWYVDSNNPSKEELFFIQSSHYSSSWYNRQELYE